MAYLATGIYLNIGQLATTEKTEKTKPYHQEYYNLQTWINTNE
jgi:beta-galactosidase beta subunit